MTAGTIPYDRLTDAPKEMPSYLTEVTETIRDDALAVAQARLSPAPSRLCMEDLLQHPTFFDYFKYEMASRVADVLAALGEPIQEIYLRDSSSDTDGGIARGLPLDATLRLLALVDAHSGTLDAWIAALDTALTGSLRVLPSPALMRRASVLDVLQISEEEARYCPRRRGMLSSVFAPPIKLWQREV